MSWQDRLREAAYTSPSGQRIVFQYEDVSRTLEKKTTGFEFPDADGSYVQDLGVSGRRFPLRIFFSGGDHDQQATAFDAALAERGTGRLEHPIYGVFDVVPFGTVNQRDDLKTAANQSVFEVTFWDTINIIYPTAQQDVGSSILSGVGDYNGAVSNEFNNVINTDSAFSASSFKSKYQSLLNGATSVLQPIANTQNNVQRQFDAINSSINNGLNVLVADPLTLAFQTTQLLQAPARAITSITARLDAYNNLANSIITGQGAVVNPASNQNASNDFHTNDLYASTAVTGSVVSVVNNQFDTKNDAVESADLILTQFDNVAAWRDDNFQALEEVDTGTSYQQLQEVVALTAGFLVELSFDLKQERTIILDRNRTIIDLVGELYGSVDDQLDFFINTNNLSGDEILELPRGRRIVYYV